MTALTRQTPSNSSSGFLFLFLAVVAALVLLATAPHLPVGMPTEEGVNLPPLSQHALLHSDAKIAWNYVRSKGYFCKWQCSDGRDRYVCAMDHNQWAVVVANATRTITAFTCGQEYACTVIDTTGCNNPWRMKHP